MKIDHSQFKTFPCCFDTSRYRMIRDLKRYIIFGYKDGLKQFEVSFRFKIQALSWAFNECIIELDSFELSLGNGEVLEKWAHRYGEWVEYIGWL